MAGVLRECHQGLTVFKVADMTSQLFCWQPQSEGPIGSVRFDNSVAQPREASFTINVGVVVEVNNFGRV